VEAHSVEKRKFQHIFDNQFTDGCEVISLMLAALSLAGTHLC
jgi:hypothetical protein